MFLLDAGGFPPGQGHSPETLEGIAKLAEKYKVNKIIIEANFGDGMYAKLLQPHLMARYPVGVEEIKHNVQKERRICDTLEPVIQSLMVFDAVALRAVEVLLHEGLIDHEPVGYQLFFQLTRMTRDKGALAKDDRLDALAMAVAYWSKALAVETEKVVQAKRDEMLKGELERYMAHAIGYRPKRRLYATTGHER